MPFKIVGLPRRSTQRPLTWNCRVFSIWRPHHESLHQLRQERAENTKIRGRFMDSSRNATKHVARIHLDAVMRPEVDRRLSFFTNEA